MLIGLISDTHGFLDPLVFRYFKDCDEIWHAGDFGSLEVAEQLSQFKPMRGVFGNIDDGDIRARFAEDLHFTCEELAIWITHIGGHPGKYPRRIRQQFTQGEPNIFICGHSHELSAGRDPQSSGMWHLNPGAAGHQGFHTMRTLLRLRIETKRVSQLQVVELGPRGRQPKP